MPRGRNPKSQQLSRDSIFDTQTYGSAAEYNRRIYLNLRAVIEKYYRDPEVLKKLFNLTYYDLERYGSGQAEIPAQLLWRMANHMHISIGFFFISSPFTDDAISFGRIPN